MWIYVITFQISVTLSSVYTQSTTIKPTCYTPHHAGGGSTCFDKYAVIPGHINCLKDHPTGHPYRVTDNGEHEIERVHNDIRSNVIPKAGNMMEISYSKGLGGSALRLARHCLQIQQSWYQRTSPGAYHPGQNMYISPSPLNWTDVIHAWAAENASFIFGGSNDNTLVANYTQLIWADTATVGCGAADCSSEGFYIYICHYGPTYDVSKQDTPYIQANNSCDLCPSKCNTNGTSTLCDCRGKLCLGGSKLNLDTCDCECISEVNTYNGTLCELECEDKGDDARCNSAPYTPDTCGTNLTTVFHCPWMCNVCPYADKEYKEGSVLLPWQKGLSLCPTTTTSPPTSHGASTMAPGTARVSQTASKTSGVSTQAPTTAPTTAGPSTRTTVTGTGNGSNQQLGRNVGSRPASISASFTLLIIVLVCAALY